MTVSILLATKDRPQFLPRAIASVLAQTDPDWQLCVLDNGEPMAHLVPSDRRIVYRHHPATGSADAYRQALAMATGELVCTLADDDELTPQAVRVIRERIGDAEWGYGRTDYERDGAVIMRLGDPWDLPRLRSFYYLGGAVFWRKRLSDRLGGFDPDFNLVGDYDLYLRFGEDSTPVYLADETLYVYHDHPGAETRTRTAEQAAQVARIVGRS